MDVSSAGPSLDPRLSPSALRLVPAVLAAAVVALQIAYPLVAQGPPRDRVTVLVVVCFAAASLAHALVWRGPTFALVLFATTALGGLAVEVLGVPVVVALAWTMMAYPAYVVSEVIGGASAARAALVGGWALASWDLFLDPQMVQAGHWEWSSTGPALAGIPLTNHVAWFVIATLMMVVLRAAAPTAAPDVDDRVPLALYGWTYASSVMAHALFFDLPTSAVAGGIGMGVVVLALVRRLR